MVRCEQTDVLLKAHLSQPCADRRVTSWQRIQFLALHVVFYGVLNGRSSTGSNQRWHRQVSSSSRKQTTFSSSSPWTLGASPPHHPCQAAPHSRASTRDPLPAAVETASRSLPVMKNRCSRAICVFPHSHHRSIPDLPSISPCHQCCLSLCYSNVLAWSAASLCSLDGFAGLLHPEEKVDGLKLQLDWMT